MGCAPYSEILLSQTEKPHFVRRGRAGGGGYGLARSACPVFCLWVARCLLLRCMRSDCVLCYVIPMSSLCSSQPQRSSPPSSKIVTLETDVVDQEVWQWSTGAWLREGWG